LLFGVVGRLSRPVAGLVRCMVAGWGRTQEAVGRRCLAELGLLAVGFGCRWEDMWIGE
jgi:hypothetical protein